MQSHSSAYFNDQTIGKQTGRRESTNRKLVGTFLVQSALTSSWMQLCLDPRAILQYYVLIVLYKLPPHPQSTIFYLKISSSILYLWAAQNYVSLFSCESNNPQIQSTESGKPFTISINIIRKRLSAIRRKKSIGPDGIPGEILKLGGEAMIPYLARLLDITMNNNASPGDWITATVVPISKGGTDRQLETVDRSA